MEEKTGLDFSKLDNQTLEVLFYALLVFCDDIHIPNR
jgi:hypothetical protein